MPFGTYHMPKIENKPTFLQYLKTTKLGNGVVGKTKFEVELIWLPGKFDNVTLVTHAFRYIATEKHPLYLDVIEWANEVRNAISEDSDGVAIAPMLYVTIESLTDKTIAVHEDEKKTREVTFVGENGVRFATP